MAGTDRSVREIVADGAGGLWLTSKELVQLKNGVVTSHVESDGTHGFQSVSGDPDGSVWVGRRVEDAPLCNVSGRGVTCFGKNEGIPPGEVNAVIADGSGGLWLGGSTALVHWRSGRALETYSVRAPVTSLARTPRGTRWVGLLGDVGLRQLIDGALKPFGAPPFDSSDLTRATR